MDQSHAIRRLRKELGFTGDLDGMIAFAKVKVLAREWLLSVHSALAEAGYEPELAETLIAVFQLSEANSVLPSTLANRLDIPKTTLTARLKRMEQLGWIAREIDPDNRRSIPIVLTAKGRKAMQEVVRVYAAACQPYAAVTPEIDALVQAIKT